MNARIQTATHEFRAALQADIAAWSWGEVAFPRTSSSRWQDKKGTLDDESIFGPRESYRCFCRTFFGQELEGVYCHICWSVIEKSESRQKKFAMIPLRQAIPHPLEELFTDLWVIPVLPAAVRDKHAQLDSLYDQIVRNCDSADKVRSSFDEIIGVIWPSFCGSSHHDTKVILGRGMAITPRRERSPEPLALWKSRICTKCHEKEKRRSQ